MLGVPADRDRLGAAAKGSGECHLPGVIETPMQDTVLEMVSSLLSVSVEELGRLRNATVPLGHEASADECAGAIWFLLSDEAGYMNGQAINFTGGLVTR